MSAKGFAPVPFNQVKLTGRFWCERVETVLTKTIPAQHAKLRDITVLDSLKLSSPSPPRSAPQKIRAISYFLWCNRAQGSMLVWIPEI
jgi:DUF1680 family protein